MRLEVRRAWAGLRAAQQRIEVARAAVAEAEESLRITQNRYQAGMSNVTDLLRNETAVLESRTRYLAAVHDQRVAATMLELAAGGAHRRFGGFELMKLVDLPCVLACVPRRPAAAARTASAGRAAAAPAIAVQAVAAATQRVAGDLRGHRHRPRAHGGRRSPAR